MTDQTTVEEKLGNQHTGSLLLPSSQGLDLFSYQARGIIRGLVFLSSKGGLATLNSPME